MAGEIDIETNVVNIDMTGSGMDGEGFVGSLVRTGQYGATTSDTDAQVLDKFQNSVVTDVLATIDPDADAGILEAALAATGGAAMIGTASALTGSVMRTVQDLVEQDLPITPYVFGGKGTVTDNDTVALGLLADGVSEYLGAHNVQFNDPAPEILFPGRAKGWRTTDTLALDGRCHIRMLSPVCPSMLGSVAGIGLHIINTAGESAPGATRSDCEEGRCPYILVVGIS